MPVELKVHMLDQSSVPLTSTLCVFILNYKTREAMQRSGWVGKRNGTVPKRREFKCKDLEKEASLTCPQGRRKASRTVSQLPR